MKEHADIIRQGDRAKAYWLGTHRTHAPADTLASVLPHLSDLGITRIADITGLDRIGIPTAQAIRPMSRSLSVAQGKGLTDEAAQVSAAMEAAEAWHAETYDPPQLRRTDRATLSLTEHAISLAGLDFGGEFQTNSALETKVMSWVPGTHLFDGQATWLPLDCVHLDFTRPLETDFLVKSTNGLGSGNTLPEAIAAALFEVIERDCTADFRSLSREEKLSRKLTKVALSQSAAVPLVERIEGSGLALDVWETTNSIGISAYWAEIYDYGHRADGLAATPVLQAQGGAGCHLDPAIAMCRAITEAAQSRLTVISGTRDDLSGHDYERADDQNRTRYLNRLFEEATGQAKPARLPDQSGDTSGADVATCLRLLANAGITEAIAVDLTKPSIGIPVVRVVVPWLGTALPMHVYAKGRRHLAL